MRLYKIFIIIIFFISFILLNTTSYAGEIELGWKSPQDSAEFVKYRVYWSDQPGEYSQYEEVSSEKTSIVIKNLENNKLYYFVATTVTSSGKESLYSNEVKDRLDTDTDQDGIFDQDELNIYGTDPNRADTDGDGLDDGQELAYWQDAWNQDIDGDGLVHLLDQDADNDGVADGLELNDMTDPADPNSFIKRHDDEQDATPLPVADVETSTWREPHAPTNTSDGDLSTRWAAEGDGEWLRYDIGALARVDGVAVAWTRGDERQAFFTIALSVDGQVWTDVFSGASSGETLEPELYAFAPTWARYVRLTGHGNTSNLWNNIAEVQLHGTLDATPLPVADVETSTWQEPHAPTNTSDGDLSTRWAAEGDGEWLRYDIGALARVDGVAVAWTRGDERQAFFTIALSVDGQVWTDVFSGASSGETLEPELYAFAPTWARYVRLTGHGNTSNLWNNIAEVQLHGTLDATPLPVADVETSTWREPHTPTNTSDGDLSTRWAAEGDGEWLRYDIGALARVDGVAVAWTRGDERQAFFTIALSVDGQVWTDVFSGASSGETLEPELYAFAPTWARYVRLTGHGNTSNLWNNIAEVQLHGFVN